MLKRRLQITLVLLLVSIIIISGCAQQDSKQSAEQKKTVKAITKLTVTSRCILEPKPCEFPNQIEITVDIPTIILGEQFLIDIKDTPEAPITEIRIEGKTIDLTERIGQALVCLDNMQLGCNIVLDENTKTKNVELQVTITFTRDPINPLTKSYVIPSSAFVLENVEQNEQEQTTDEQGQSDIIIGYGDLSEEEISNLLKRKCLEEIKTVSAAELNFNATGDQGFYDSQSAKLSIEPESNNKPTDTDPTHYGEWDIIFNNIAYSGQQRNEEVNFNIEQSIYDSKPILVGGFKGEGPGSAKIKSVEINGKQAIIVTGYTGLTGRIIGGLTGNVITGGFTGFQIASGEDDYKPIRISTSEIKFRKIPCPDEEQSSKSTSTPQIATTVTKAPDCTVTYTPPKEQWQYGPCQNSQKALTTKVTYTYKGKECVVSEIAPKNYEPCGSAIAPTSPTTSPTLTSQTLPTSSSISTGSPSDTTSSTSTETQPPDCQPHGTSKYVCAGNYQLTMSCYKKYSSNESCVNAWCSYQWIENGKTLCQYGCGYDTLLVNDPYGPYKCLTKCEQQSRGVILKHAYNPAYLTDHNNYCNSGGIQENGVTVGYYYKPTWYTCEPDGVHYKEQSITCGECETCNDANTGCKRLPSSEACP